MYCDGAWGNTGASATVVLISPSGIKLCYTIWLQFTNEADKCRNNIAEYEAILLGLCKLRAIGVPTCILRTDLKVVASQIEKSTLQESPSSENTLPSSGGWKIISRALQWNTLKERKILKLMS
jgi:ribonuclease HI